ncbi:hypothetical protein BWQ96_04139 [Gracilariopsis chorda]|uniref:Glycosyltransferase 61 catalytic domain-containing protein n=1 Tax=Gracilariopsis chorda TaxID=448386 RepID=A0A2V3IVL8_9FLOR|nr:hypothetical protein BWQ96_04139 [Gracilariopsis chorda]|eukprot:PXF46133.1 hypothetical protein BWQ96_04139 [Gracilariopsis chorda]
MIYIMFKSLILLVFCLSFLPHVISVPVFNSEHISQEPSESRSGWRNVSVDFNNLDDYRTKSNYSSRSPLIVAHDFELTNVLQNGSTSGQFGANTSVRPTSEELSVNLSTNSPHNEWGRNNETSISDTRTSDAPQNNSRVEDKAVKPFQMRIEDQIFYGGLITYSHMLHPARICRVMNACIRNDDTLVLPRWMQRHDNLLSFHCGHRKLSFSLEDNSPPPSLKNLDLVGLTSPRPSMPDFVRDFAPNTVVFDLIYGDHELKQSCHSRKGTSCDSFPSLNQSLNTAIFLPSRLEAINEKRSWVREFVKLMKPPNAGKQSRILYKNIDVTESKELGMQCFRSAFFTRGPYNKFHVMNDHMRELNFLKSHGIQKEARILRQDKSNDIVEEASCDLNITISNRKADDGDSKLIGRYITNIPTLRAEILKQAERIPGLNIKLDTITLEGKSLWWQINAMQKTDVWIAGHGPLLTNMLFLRQNSSVIELQPFAYYPQTYENLAEHLAHVRYERYIANPDVEAFETCIRQLYTSDHPSYKDAQTIFERFRRASMKFFQSDSTHSLVLHTLAEEGLDYVKACARMQRLTTDAHVFAVAIVRHARVRCGLPKPSTNEADSGDAK